MAGKLTAAQVETFAAARPATGSRRLNDGGGLFLLVAATGSPGWRFRYYAAGKDKLLSLGTWPDVGLTDARRLADVERERIERGADPAATRKAEAAATSAAGAVTFYKVATEWLDVVKVNQSHKTWRKKNGHLTWLKGLWSRPVSELTGPECFAALEAIATSRPGEVAARVGGFGMEVMARAVAKYGVKANPFAGLNFSGQVPTPEGGHRAALIDPAEVGKLLAAIEVPDFLWDGRYYKSYASVRNCLRVIARTGLRNTEARCGRWEELKDLDGDSPGWIIPAFRWRDPHGKPAGGMKGGRRPHYVPLSRQVVEILKTQREIVEGLGGSEWMFPGGTGLSNKPVTEAGLLKPVKTLSNGAHSVHGFRSTMSTLLNEAGWDSALIDMQQARRGGVSAVSKIYDRSQRLDQRREMMQAYADLLDSLKDKASA